MNCISSFPPLGRNELRDGGCGDERDLKCGNSLLRVPILNHSLDAVKA